MKLKSKNSFLKRISCIALSLMLCLTSFTLAGFVPTLEAEAATNANITVSGYGVLIGDEQNRITNNALTIVNDQQNANFSVGFVEFDLNSIDISSLKENGSVVTSANYTFNYSIDSSEREAMGLSCYYSTQNDSELVGTGAKINSGTAKNAIFTGDDGAHISRAVSHFGLKKIADFDTTAGGSDTYTVNLTTMINYAIQNNQTKARLIIMLKQPGGLSGPDWSDTIVTASTGAVTTSFGHEVMGNVTIDPIIYIHGDYTGGLSNGDQYDYMMQGDVVADGSYDGECKTAVSSTKTITNVEVVDTNNCLYLESGILKGSLGGGYANESSYTTTSTATLRFTFDDNTYEYHKLPVKPNPVATHTLAAAFNWHQPFLAYRSDSAFEVLAVGSYGTFGDNSGGSHSINSTIGKVSEYSGTQNFAKMYAPCDPSYSAFEDNEKVYISSLNSGTNNSAFSRTTGFYATYCWNKNGSRDLSVNSKEAVYYLDLSSSNNFGVTHTAGNNNYSIKLFVGNLYWNSKTDTSTCSKDVDSITKNSGSSTMNISTDQSLNSISSKNGPSTTTGYVTVSGVASKGETTGTHSIKYQAPICTKSCKVSSQINTNIKLVVSDKTNVRNYYNTKITDVKKLDSRCYTTTSWKALSDALLEVEEYLNDNTDISSKSTKSLDSAYNNLQKSTDVKNQHPSYTITQTVSPTCTEQGYDVITCSVCGQTQNINYTPAKGHSYSDIYAPTYSTGNSYKDTEDYYTHRRSCSDCQYNDTQSCKFGALVKNDNTATLTCSDCNGTYTLDLEAYNKAVAEANTSINNTVAYTPGSINDLSLVLSEQATKLNSAKTQDDVDSCTETIISKNKLAKDGGVLVLEQYAITVKYFDATGNDLGVGEKGATSKTYPAVNYGSIQNIVAPTSYDGKKYSVYKWTRDRQGSNTISGLNSSSLDVVVKGASTYYVFLKRTSVDDTKVNDNAVITLNNKSGNIADIGYVPMKTDGTATEATVKVNTNAGTITIGNTTLTAPKYSFYNLSGFTINNVDASTLPTITLTKNVVIKPVYTPRHRVTIERANAGIRINGQDVNSYDADWNRKVVMTYNDTVPNGKVVIWKDGNGNILGQGKTYTFYANSNVKISTSFETTPIAEPTASIGLFSYDPTDNKVTVVNNFFVPDGMTVTKAGVILSTKNSTPEALIAQTNGKFEGGPESFTSTGNQIRISVSRTATTSFTMHALAYVVVEDENGNTDTYYAPTVRSITYTATKA